MGHAPRLRSVCHLALAAALAACAEGGDEQPTSFGPPAATVDAATVVADAGDWQWPSDGGTPIDSGVDGAIRSDASVSDAAAIVDGGSEVGPDGLSVLAKALPSGKDYSGWTWVETAGSQCRDGSAAGYYYRRGSENALLVYMNGGGACADSFFCGLNPKNVNEDLPIELLVGGTINLVTGPNQSRQVAPNEGVFKKDPRNPVGNWNMIYIPYCTGDIHSGVNKDITIPGVTGKQQFVGYTNYGLFLNSFGPSYTNTKRVLLTGSSAGGFGALFNFDRTQQFFDPYSIKVTTISDSGVPLRDPYMPACLQKRWREYWGLSSALPKECVGCFNADGGGIVAGFGNYLFKQKYKDRMLGGFISARHDGIIRSFYAPGLNATAGGPDNCTLEPSANVVSSAIGVGQYDGPKFAKGLKDVIDNVVGPEQAGYYMLPTDTHMHLWRARYFEKNGTDKTIAEWVAEILKGTPSRVGTF